MIISFEFNQLKLLLIQKGYIAVETSSKNEKREKGQYIKCTLLKKISYLP